MYKSFHVKNFRCFKDLQINDLGRVNLIAGKNNTGKTALMEAMYLHTRPLVAKRRITTILAWIARGSYRTIAVIQDTLSDYWKMTLLPS